MAKSDSEKLRKNLSQSIEDYLKAVYELTQTEERASTNALAAYLEIAPASVTGMLQKLAENKPPLLDYMKHRGVSLTEEGRIVALETIRHHRLLELFLVQILGYEWHEIHDEADRLEHVISERFERRIADALGDPDHDPHGDPIPRADLSMPESEQRILSGLKVGDKGTVKRVRDTFPELLEYLSEQGLVPGAEFHISEISEIDSNLHIVVKNKGQDIVLGPRASNQVYVELM
jgi:DtxR family Mn-dependent transcriptional regulator